MSEVAEKTEAVEKADAKVFEKGLYRANKRLPIYDSTEKNKRQKKVGELSPALKANKGRNRIYASAFYEQGELFTVLQVIEKSNVYYGNTPSGIVVIADKKGSYCTKM